MAGIRDGRPPRAAATHPPVTQLPPASRAAGARPRLPRSERLEGPDARPAVAGSAEARPAAARPAAARPPVAARPVTPKARPDSRPMRVAFGFAAVATASALATALALPAGSTAAGSGPAAAVQAAGGQDQTGVRHVTRYVQLAPGQTAPPQSVVQPAATLPPKRVVVVTRQSGG